MSSPVLWSPAWLRHAHHRQPQPGKGRGGGGGDLVGPFIWSKFTQNLNFYRSDHEESAHRSPSPEIFLCFLHTPERVIISFPEHVLF